MIYKLVVYGSWGPSQQESNKHLRVSNLADKDITKIRAQAGAIQTETRKYLIDAAFNISDVSFVVKQLFC